MMMTPGKHQRLVLHSPLGTVLHSLKEAYDDDDDGDDDYDSESIMIMNR